ncbi:MAG: STAS domain-containing protein [Ignavibacteria bacterium]|nr:STAS domain-containing protein [Ignavibacteria bacterium]
MDFVQTTYGSIVVVRSVTNVANISNAQQLKNFLLGFVQEGRTKIVFDCTNIETMDSTFLGVLVLIYKQIYTQGGVIGLMGINESISITLGLTKLDEAFRVFPTLQEVVKELI